MKKALKYLFILLFSYTSLIGKAQKEYNHWYFGFHAALDFNSGSPVALNNSSMNSLNGAGCISDEFGNLLFYTDGNKVWNRNHQLMPNGIGLFGHNSSSSGALIVRDPGNSDKFYIFYVWMNPNFPGVLTHQYSIVDMTLDNGLGDISVKNQILHTGATAQQAVIMHNNNLDIWILGIQPTPSNNSSYDVYAYSLSASGLNSTPVISSSVLGPCTNITLQGSMKAGPANDKICVGMSCPTLLNFDNFTGVSTNPISLPVSNITGIEFSSSGRYLYTNSDTTLSGNGSGGLITQFDLSNYNASSIAGSKTVIGFTENTSSLQIGPDDRIYCWGHDTTYQISSQTLSAFYLARIEEPDSGGVACQFNPSVVFLQGNYIRRGLPQTTPNILGLTFRDSTTCFGDTSFFELTSRAYDSVLWNFDDTASGAANFSTDTLGMHVFSAPGTYDVTLSWVWNGVHDTVVRPITIYPQPYANLGPDTILCEGDSMAIQFADSNFSYLWNTGDTVMNLQILQADTYHVEVSNVCGLARDTVVIDSLIPALVDLPLDTVFCAGNQLLLDASVALGSYQWSTGDTSAFILADSTGVYTVTATNLCGSSSDTIDIGVMPLVSADLGNDTAICNGNWVLLDVNDTASTYLWDDGTTAPQRWINTTGMYRVSITNMCGTKEDSLQLWSLTAPSIDLGPDTVLCPGDVYTVGDSILFGGFTWSTGATTDSISVTSQNTYSVTVDNGCGIDQDTVQVWYDSSPLTELGPDATYCITQLITLDASHSRATYLWQDGSTDSSLLADTSGTYWVEVTNLCGFDDDTVRIKYDVPISFSLGADTAICDYDSILLHAPAVNATYQWNTGSTDSTLFANAGSTYFVQATNACGSFSDSITIDALYIPQVDFPAGDTLCEGGVLTAHVESNNATNILWNDGNTDNERKFRNSGTYTVSVTNICGTVADSLTLYIAPYPEPDLGPDTILCIGESFVLSPSNIGANHTYAWNTGETDSSITILEDGIYDVTVTSPYGCEGYDEIEVRACGTTLYIPTAFTPNGDGLNDEFKVEGTDITRFYIAIYNRWGNQVFESTDPTQTWNGTFQNQGEPVNAGVFTYVLWYASGQYQSKEISGSVTVIR